MISEIFDFKRFERKEEEDIQRNYLRKVLIVYLSVASFLLPLGILSLSDINTIEKSYRIHSTLIEQDYVHERNDRVFCLNKNRSTGKDLIYTLCEGKK